MMDEKMKAAMEETVKTMSACGFSHADRQNFVRGAEWTLEYLRSQQEPVGEVGKMPGSDGFTLAAFRAADVPVGTKLYANPTPSAPVVHAVFETVDARSMGAIGTTEAPIKRVEVNDDGSFTVVINHWPFPSAPAVPEWLRAVDTEMITTHLGVANADDDYEAAREKLHQIIDWHVSVALDPAVNGGKVLVPVELLNRVQDAIGRFVSDEGWGQRDMETCDDVSAMLAAPSPTEKKES